MLQPSVRSPVELQEPAVHETLVFLPLLVLQSSILQPSVVVLQGAAPAPDASIDPRAGSPPAARATVTGSSALHLSGAGDYPW
ncbi:hypothetical protein GQ55_4G180400 [Panicum hallii var. hallii]|uniref:Uncharacterized protein n=1 Tax=Panicum hallii var. hallii TaxID=1504633 RepID=A0A2T7DYU0_9POAL|nr:hypothetical protein GQ55_4G180400 [Panicum hallii var. hallii]